MKVSLECSDCAWWITINTFLKKNCLVSKCEGREKVSEVQVIEYEIFFIKPANNFYKFYTRRGRRSGGGQKEEDDDDERKKERKGFGWEEGLVERKEYSCIF